MHESGTWYFASCPSLWYSVGNIVSHIILCSVDVSQAKLNKQTCGDRKVTQVYYFVMSYMYVFVIL